MRNAMICVSVMLALFLGWPLAFGGKEKGIEAPVRAAVAAPTVASITAMVTPAKKPAAPVAESCYKRFQRENKQCAGTTGGACRMDAADNWDRCETTGFWPE